MPDANDQTFKDAAAKMNEINLMKAFRKSTFVYGTQGKGSSAVLALKTLHGKAWSHRAFTEAEKGIARKLNIFEPGVRVGTYLSGDIQMMDMYYGMEGNNLYQKRDPVIAEFIHHVMGYKQPFSMQQSGRDMFMKNSKGNIEGWEPSKWTRDGRKIEGPRYNGNTATVEISRAIRWGLQFYGGKLIFEGKEVYYSQVFNMTGFKGDTDREAISLFQYFQPNLSTVKFGRGTITFYWNGREVVPTHCHFLSNWGFPVNQSGNLERVKQTVAILEMQAKRTNGRLPSIDQYAPKDPWSIGALQHHPLNRGNFAEWLKRKNVTLNESLWNKFCEKPAGLEGVPTDKVLEIFEKGLALGYI